MEVKWIYKKIFCCALLLHLICLEKIKAQCSGCTTTINSNLVTTYVVAPGTTVCVASGFDYTGTITLSGGTLCNEGTVHNLNLNSGTFNNYGIFSKTSGTQVIQNTGKLVINSFGIAGASPPNGIDLNNLDILTVNTNDSVILNIYKASIINIANNFTATRGVFKIVTGLTNPGAGSFISTCSFSTGKVFTISNTCQFYLTNNTPGTFNFGKAATLDGSRNKILSNYGTINCNNSLNISGNGLGSANVQINNQVGATVNVQTSFNNSMNNATVTISNSGTLTVQNSYNQSGNASTSVSLTNTGTFTTIKDIQPTLGTITNQSIMEARDFVIDNSTFTNTSTGSMKANRDLKILAGSAVFTNNGAILVTELFRNGATVNLGQRSLIATTHFTNQLSGDINGPTSVGGNDSNYAFIMVDSTSINHSYLTGYLSIWDRTPPGIGPIFLDTHTNDSRIAATVIWNPPCSFINMSITAIPNPPVCYGTAVSMTVTSTFSLTIPPFINISIPMTPSGSYTWNPGGLTGSSVTTPTLATTTVYTVTAPFFGGACTQSNTYTITVHPKISVTPTDICQGVPTLLTASGAVTYTWTPATGLSSTSGATVTATAPSPTVFTTYTVTGTDANGCVTKATVRIRLVPSITIPSYTICTGDSVTIVPTSTLEVGVSYTDTWSPPAGLSSTITPIVTASPSVTTVYTLTVLSQHGCTGSATTTVTVGTPLVTVNSATIFIGGTATLTASGAATYSWTPPTGLSSTTGATVTAMPSVTTVYTVVGTFGACSDTAISTVTVIPSIVPGGSTPCLCVSSFAPRPDKKYLISAWVREDNAAPTKLSFNNPSVFIDFGDGSLNYISSTGPFKAKGNIIDGWQRIEEVFAIPDTAFFLSIRLESSSGDVLFDDIRIFPFDGSMKSYVYDPSTLRLVAELDERNYATLYEYDEEGKLTRVKKETEKGISTIKESRNSAPKQ